MKVLTAIKFTPADPVVLLDGCYKLPMGHMGRVEHGTLVLRDSGGVKMTSELGGFTTPDMATRQSKCQDLGPALISIDEKGVLHLHQKDRLYACKREPVKLGHVPVGGVVRYNGNPNISIVTKRHPDGDVVIQVWHDSFLGMPSSLSEHNYVNVIGTAEFVYLDI